MGMALGHGRTTGCLPLLHSASSLRSIRLARESLLLLGQ